MHTILPFNLAEKYLPQEKIVHNYSYEILILSFLQSVFLSFLITAFLGWAVELCTDKLAQFIHKIICRIFAIECAINRYFVSFFNAKAYFLSVSEFVCTDMVSPPYVITFGISPHLPFSA